MVSSILPIMFLLSLMLLTNEATAEKNQSNIIELGSWLSPSGNHTSWVSNSGHFGFGFYHQGNGFAVGIWLIDDNTVVWTANRDSPPLSFNSKLIFSNNGRLLLQKEEGHAEDLVPDVITESAASASMLDSGNFVLYDKNYSVIWQSFDNPTDTILGGQNLTEGNKLVSSMSESDHSSGHFFLNMQSDGNLVAYPVNSSAGPHDAYWAYYYYYYPRKLSVDPQGFLCRNNFQCLSNSTSLSSNSNNTTPPIYRATLDVDGNFRLYVHQFEGNTSSRVQMLWQAISDECQIKGFCGLNSYCSNISGKAACQCYPGFVPSSSNNGGNSTMFLNCKSNHSKSDCQSSEDPMLYNITSFEDMSWGDYPYSVIPLNLEACHRSYREDCDCGAVLYTSGNCKKYKLPIRYGRRLQNASGIALFKVPSENVISASSQKQPKLLVDNKKRLIIVLASSLGSVLLFCLAFAVFIFFTYRRQVCRYTSLSESANLGFTGECSLRSFSFDELVQSTGSFIEEIGRGSFGAVYKGTIGDSNTRIAVKRLEVIVDEGEREFRAEITAIARTHHRNLVKLIGFCIDGSKKLLVYEYASNGSLANLLFKSEKHLSSRDRIKIALDVARGILYLHEECEVRIIHCNIKPQNILMDEAWTAKISEFGLARLLKPGHSRTRPGDEVKSGYLAPELQKKEASVSVEVDIYSYGVVLLEIICRRNNIDANASSVEEIHLSSWVYRCFVAGELNKLVADGGEDVDWRIMEIMVKVGLWCVHDDPSLRPSMKTVILMLEGLKDIPLPPSPAYLAV
ncbi:hypothetical protein TanjilG_26251 [Lupinus angustifolius]|uniref:Receptor-like serine/threonine-protein kinase n=1 Tax=Lupinus angustifolius TaxID=3871 RepID=A0A4P1R2W8_LUPAN|nr:PREDICTED: G-type lectin S-receptor-like serine/threonine-protein kinase LECRK2 [Lupinus angustifolius]OIV99913.1 hypothetical protein TanjilG_26251 [Lupinus angustifolius]